MKRRKKDDEQWTIIDKYRPKTIESDPVRVDSKRVVTTLEVYPAVVDFEDILALTTVEYDDDTEAPWESCDGYEHEVVWRRQGDKPDDFWNRSAGAFHNRSESGVIIVTRETAIEWQGPYSKNSGMSRQVYEERIAECRRQGIKTLVEWYRDGWHAFGAVCEFLGENESVWGIYADDEDDEHVQEMRVEIAEQVAHALKKKGFEIVNEPADAPPRNRKLIWHKDHLAHSMGFKDIEAYQKWVTSPCPHP
jgi:hypothetical protein